MTGDVTAFESQASDPIPAQVARILGRFVALPEGEALSLETPLLEEGLGLDSITLLECLLAIEEALGCAIPPEEITPEAVATLGSLAQLVAHRLASADA